ncbi:TNT domain-containing protein, partial [Streptococcus gallolyticus]
ELSSESLLTAIDSKVNQVSQTTSLSYSDSQYLSFVNDASFAKGIKSVNKQLKEQEKLAKEEAAKEAQAVWAKQHPVEAWLQSQAAKDAQFFEGARQTLEQTHWDYFGGALDKSLALSVLGFISKASETVDQLAIGIGELSHLTVEGLEMGVDYVTGHQTPQWIKDDVTGATNNLLAASEFTDSLLALDAEAWGAVGKELGKIGTDFVTAVKTGDDYALGGYVFDVATLVGPASISKLKYVDEASALTKLAETSEVASTVGKVEDGVSLSFEKLMSAEDAQKYIQWNKYAEAGIEPEGRIKLTDWLYAPEDNFYLSHKNIYDNPDFVNQLTGEFIYPGTPESALGRIDGSVHVDGFLNGKFDNITLQPGTIIDRYGSNSNGRYFSPIGTNFENRALPPFMINEPYRKYIILKPINSKAGIIAPWFNQPGMGIQYFTELSVKDLIDRNYIRILK